MPAGRAALRAGRQVRRRAPPLDSVVDFGRIGGELHAGLVAFGEDTTLTAIRGYDNATGLGSANRAYLESFG